MGGGSDQRLRLVGLARNTLGRLQFCSRDFPRLLHGRAWTSGRGADGDRRDGAVENHVRFRVALVPLPDGDSGDRGLADLFNRPVRGISIWTRPCRSRECLSWNHTSGVAPFARTTLAENRMGFGGRRAWSGFFAGRARRVVFGYGDGTRGLGPSHGQCDPDRGIILTPFFDAFV